MVGDTARAPQQDRSREKLERIYASALDLLIAGGWDAVTVGAVERRSKVSRSTLYLRFPTRDALLAYTRQRLHDEVAADQAAAFERARAARPATVETAVRAAVEALAGICRTYGPALYRVDHGAGGGEPPEAMTVLSREFRSIIEPVLPHGADRRRIEFCVELVFSTLVGRMRPEPAFPGHQPLPWPVFLGELSRAAARYLTG